MRTLSPRIALTGLLAFSSVAGSADWTEAQLAAADALRDRARSGTQAIDHVTSLVTEVGPRFAGSAGDTAAVNWARQKLNALGFSNVRTQDVLVPRWVRGTAEVRIASPYPQTLVALALGGSVGTPEAGIQAPVLEVASFDELTLLDADAAQGKIVFINHRMERSRTGADYGVVVRGRTLGPSVAAEKGAVALIVRSVGTSDDRIAHTGALSYRADAPRIPAFAISNPDADLLARQIKSGQPVRMFLKSTARELPPAWSANVIGEIPGQGELADEIVLLGAHLDSWDVGHGAQDDAAGVGIVMEAARLLRPMDPAPSRTVRVVLFANEEFGLHGAREYASQIGDEVQRHVLAFEADVGAGPVWRFESHVAPEALSAIATMQQVVAPLGVESGSNEGRPGADIGPLRDLGVASLNLSLDATHYFDVHHSDNDTLATIDRAALDQSVAAFAVSAYLAATKTGDFGRVTPPSSATPAAPSTPDEATDETE